jgi:membrane protein EpsK
MTAAFVTFLGNYILWRKLTPQLRVKVKSFDRGRFKSLMGMGGWVMVQRVGSMLLKRVDLIVVNIVFGSAATGGYGSVLQFSVLIESLASAASTVIRPVIIKRYVQKDILGLQQLSTQAVKLLGLTLALPVGLICGFSRPILSVWLGPSFEHLYLLLIFLTVHLGINLSVLPLVYVQSAYNKVRWPGIATMFSGFANLGLAVLLATWGKWGVIGVAVAGAFVWSLKNSVFTPIYTACIMRLKWWVFLPSIKAGVIGTLTVGLLAYASTWVTIPGNWFTLAGSASAVSILYLIGVCLVGLNRADWRLLEDLLPWQIR